MRRPSLLTWLSVSCSHGSAAFSPAGGSEGAGSILSGCARGQRVQANAWIVLLLRPCRCINLLFVDSSSYIINPHVQCSLSQSACWPSVNN